MLKALVSLEDGHYFGCADDGSYRAYAILVMDINFLIGNYFRKIGGSLSFRLLLFRCNALFIPSTSLHMGVIICIHTASICLFGQETLLFVLKHLVLLEIYLYLLCYLLVSLFTYNNIFIYKTK